MTKIDEILVFEQTGTRKRRGGWRYRFWKAGEVEPLMTSELVFETRARATEVARKVNDAMFCGEYKLRRRAGES